MLPMLARHSLVGFIFLGGPNKTQHWSIKTRLGRKLVKIVVVIGIANAIGKIMPRIVIFTAMTMFIQ